MTAMLISEWVKTQEQDDRLGGRGDKVPDRLLVTTLFFNTNCTNYRKYKNSDCNKNLTQIHISKTKKEKTTVCTKVQKHVMNVTIWENAQHDDLAFVSDLQILLSA